MRWAYSFSDTACDALRKLDRQARAQIVRYLDERIAQAEDPTRFGKPLRGQQHGYWRYRVGDYRIIVSIERDRLHVLVVKVGHRSTVYD
ncbi:MAG: type II toxin-antitoxin system RelE/ParE family toxin [Verrucomicrobia bacterium]|nr:type II toxin-antitoxin system RelE/ParE family toxin [Verrucomicrobiota bacterium]